MFEHHAQALLRPVLNVAGLDGSMAFPQISRKIMMSKLKWRKANIRVTILYAVSKRISASRFDRPRRGVG